MAVYNPTGSGSVHIDRVLTNISIAYPQGGLIGNVLMPSVPVLKQSDLYYVFGREGWLPEDDYRAPGTEATEIPGLSVSTQPYYAKEHALQLAVTDEERENADPPLAPDRDGTEMLTSKVMISREVVIRDLVTNAANYNSSLVLDLTAAPTQQWDDYVATDPSDPIKNFKDARRAVHGFLFTEPNTAIIPYLVMSYLEDHPDIIERIKYSERAILTPEIIAAVFGLQQVVVPGAGYDASGNPGRATNLSYVWGNDVILAWVPPRAGLKIPAFGYEFCWTFGGGAVQAVDRWREERRASDVLRLRRRYDLRMTALDANGKQIAGYIMKGVV
jgi:hypothetical protein